MSISATFKPYGNGLHPVDGALVAQAAPNAAPAPRGWSLTVKPIIPGHLYRVRDSGIDVDVPAPSPFDAIEHLLEQVMSCSG